MLFKIEKELQAGDDDSKFLQSTIVHFAIPLKEPAVKFKLVRE